MSVQQDVEVYRCPEAHLIRATPSNYARDDSEGLRDANRNPMYEDGLWCSSCGKPHGLSKLVLQN